MESEFVESFLLITVKGMFVYLCIVVYCFNFFLCLFFFFFIVYEYVMYGLHQQGFVRYKTASVQYHEYVEERLISTLHKFYGHLFKLVDRCFII